MSLGERLKSARKRRGLSLRALAERVEVSAQAISKYERDLDIPSSSVLLRIARVLDVPLEWFFRESSVSLSPELYRSRRSQVKKSDLYKVTEMVREWLERYLLIEEIVGERCNFIFPEIRRRIDQVEDAEYVAEELRHAWEMGEDAVSEMVAVLEGHGIRVGVMSLPAHVDALMLLANGQEPVMVVRSGIPGDRQRLSLAHELGHLILDVPKTWDEKKVEASAFRFAAAFLVPRSVAIRELGARRTHLDLYELLMLKHHYGMSMQALIYRARDLGIITPAVAKTLFQQFRTNGWHQKEPGDQYPPETSSRMERLVIRALSEGLITERRASELMGHSVRDFLERKGTQGHEDIPTFLRT